VIFCLLAARPGDRLWVVDVIAPSGGAKEMVKDLKAKVFAPRGRIWRWGRRGGK
jgi:hemolysin-activating ACP:hemolysin acyltransferase